MNYDDALRQVMGKRVGRPKVSGDPQVAAALLVLADAFRECASALRAARGLVVLNSPPMPSKRVQGEGERAAWEDPT